MRFARKRDVKEQIEGLQTIIHLQEQGRKLFAQGAEENVGKNKYLLGYLRGDVRQGAHELDLSIKYDHATITRACRDRKREKVALAEYTVEQARATLSSYVFSRMNTHNALLYEVKRRGTHLEELQVILRGLIALETPGPEAQAQLREIRRLENSVEKTRVLIATAENAHMLYRKMLDVLKDELSHLPLILDDLQKRVEVYQVELQGVRLMTLDTTEAMEAAQADMLNTETELVAEKKFRDNSLNIQKKQIERIRSKDASERHRRTLQGRRDMDFPSLMGREGMRGARLEASKAMIEYQGLVTAEVDKIKAAVQCSHLWDIAGRFLAQKKSEEDLQQQIAECERRRRELKSHLKALELERAELKFHPAPGALSSQKLTEELGAALEEESRRLAEAQHHVSQNQELLLLFENGVNNLAIRLCGVHVAGQDEFRGEAWDIFQKLQFCEGRLLHLLKVAAQPLHFDFSQEESNETFVQVRNVLEESTREEPQNLRITFEDDEDVREAFNFADIDHSYLPGREEIKKQGLKLIDDKTKVVKKKQRGASKK
ncbi:coiled-coil domain-containing protein 183 [Zootoca vivipara]|uniref:coiled-coil domain-containing protein 183 n=1 Tax=Zootoca vivipara TaxID=8524 RepID=UPI00293BFEB5|nr:coiled-coil domain-containing protein 183 [Zootoca vivipara]